MKFPKILSKLSAQLHKILHPAKVTPSEVKAEDVADWEFTLCTEVLNITSKYAKDSNVSKIVKARRDAMVPEESDANLVEFQQDLITPLPRPLVAEDSDDENSDTQSIYEEVDDNDGLLGLDSSVGLVV